MRAIFHQSQDLALKTLRELDPNYNILLAPSLRVILTESDDADFRRKVLDEFLVDHPYATQIDAGIVCAGLAVHDPKLAAEYLRKSSEKTKTYESDQPEMIYSSVFITHWARSQPREVLRFIAGIESSEYQGSRLNVLFTDLLNHHPDIFVEALEMESLKRFQEKVRPDVCVRGMDRPIPWPLIEENVPLSLEKRYEKLQQAVESSQLPQDLKKRFLTAIEAKRGK